MQINFPDGLWTQDDVRVAKEFFRNPSIMKMFQIMGKVCPKIQGATRLDRFDQAIKLETWTDCLDTFGNFTLEVAEEGSQGNEFIDMSTLSSEDFKTQQKANRARDEKLYGT